MSQAFGEPTTFWLQTKEARHLQASYRNYDKIRRLYGQVPGGMFGGDENCRPGYSDPRQAIETCGMVEMMASTERLAWLTGDMLWADRCEDVAFNSLPASMLADMKALRYLTSPNMVVSDRKSKSPGLQNGGPMLCMNPYDHRCCQHNAGQGWPYFAEHLWFATPDDGLAAVLYSASEVKAKVGAKGTEVTVREETHYPFSGRIHLGVTVPEQVAFPLYLRVPGWCEKVEVRVNGQPINAATRPRSFVLLERQWQDGDVVDLTLRQEVKIRTWTTNQNSVSVDRGPLTYSLQIGEKYVRSDGTDKWPAWEIFPTTPWNYGLVLEDRNPAAAFEVVRRSWPASDMPFTQEGTPLELRTKARRIPAWQADYLGLVGKLQPSPVKSSEPEETVTLVPMGAARLRIASFPVIGEGADAHEWAAQPAALPYHPTASHCFESDTVTALCDGVAPANSNDGSIPRFTWWDHRGTREWVQYGFDQPKKISRVEVYWFDDTGGGGCRVPKSWRVLYRDGSQWKPVTAAGPYGVAKDRFNTVSFEPVTTRGLRLDVELQPDCSGGILEWRVK